MQVWQELTSNPKYKSNGTKCLQPDDTLEGSVAGVEDSSSLENSSTMEGV